MKFHRYAGRAFYDHLARLVPKRIANCLEPTLEALRLVWIISRYYSNDDRMGQLMGRIADELSLRINSEIDPKMVLTESREDDGITKDRAEDHADHLSLLTTSTTANIKHSPSLHPIIADIQDNSNLTLSEKLRDASLAAELEDKLFKSARKYRAFQSRHKMGVRPRTTVFSN